MVETTRGGNTREFDVPGIDGNKLNALFGKNDCFVRAKVNGRRATASALALYISDVGCLGYLPCSF